MATVTVLTHEAQIEQELTRVRELVESHLVDDARALSRELAAQWPDSPQVQHWARVLEPPKACVRRDQPAIPRATWEAERQWLRANASKYPGHWLALLGDELIAADPDYEKMREQVRRRKLPEPVVHFFQPKSWPSW